MRLGLTTIAVLGALASCTKSSGDQLQAQPTRTDVSTPAPVGDPSHPSRGVAEPTVTTAPTRGPDELEAPTAASAEAAVGASAPAVSGPSFSVVARLVDAGESVPHCGIMHFEVVMKYSVLEVVDGVFEPTTLYAAVSCPEMPPTKTRGFTWTVGEIHRLKLRTAGVRRGGARVDAFEGEPGKRYELLNIDPAP
ncbi:MAG: hypothetical protein AB1Z98_38945 [Nannocystaceae bacterium]